MSILPFALVLLATPAHAATYEASSGAKGVSDQTTVWATFVANNKTFELACKLSSPTCEVRGAADKDKLGSASWAWDMRAGIVTFQGGCSRNGPETFTSTWQPPAGSAAMLTSWTTGR